MAKVCGIGLLLRDNDDYLEVRTPRSIPSIAAKTHTASLHRLDFRNDSHGNGQVEEVVREGPAYQQLRQSDLVLAVDSVRVGRRHGYALDTVKKLVLGAPGTVVTLRIRRGQQEVDVAVTRAHPRAGSVAHPAPAQAATGSQDVCSGGGHYSVQTGYEAKMAHELTLLPGQIVEVIRTDTHTNTHTLEDLTER